MRFTEEKNYGDTNKYPQLAIWQGSRMGKNRIQNDMGSGGIS